MGDIPRRYPARLSDYFTDYMAESCDLMIQLEIEFDREIDVGRMAKAAALFLDAEPLFGCRLVKEHRRLRWERLGEGERAVFFTAKDERDYDSFRSSPIDTYAGPQLKVCLWRSDGGDRLLLKVAHHAADIGGVKELVEILSGIYRYLASQPDYRPEPNIKGSRSLLQTLRHLPWYSYPFISVGWMWVEVPTLLHRSVQTLPCPGGPREPLVFIHRFIGRDETAALVDYGHARKATLNDIFVTAALRALPGMKGWNGRSRLSLETTIDMRRYIPSRRGGAVTNLSTMVFGWPNLGNDPGPDFASALDRISAMTRRGKRLWIGLENLSIPMTIYMLGRLLPFGWGMTVHKSIIVTGYNSHAPEHCFSNAGPVKTESVNFDAQPTAVRILPPTFYPDQPLLFSLTGYDGTLTLTAGVYPSQKEDAEKFFDGILGELQAIKECRVGL